MTIAFFCPTPEDFHTKLLNAVTPYEKIDVCVDNIQELVSLIKDFHDLHKCDLERYHVRLFLEGIESYGKELRKSKRLLRKKFSGLCEKCPVGFRDCIAIVQNRYCIMTPRSNNSNSNLEKK